MSWRARTARALIDGLRPGLSETAALAVVTADGEGYTVESSGRCPAGGRFEIGSITKTMTATVLASLVDDGIVDLDDEIGRWLDAGESADITLGQLATHTSGLPRLSPSHVPGVPDPYAFLTAQVAEAELRKAGSGARGVEHDYSNFGFQVLGLALERADRTAFADLLEHRVLIPLDMACSGIPGRGGGAVITGYAQGAPAERWHHHLWGAGGVEASAEDMGRYLMACLDPPDSQVGWSIRQAQRPSFEIDPLRSCGLGWPIGPPGYLGHDGGTSGFRSMLGINQPARRAAAVFVNDHDARGLARAVRQALDAS
ncbi:D-alanyl-D-alanine-carboxypeptidase/D-alanyl-D-alanine-endopeptidase [Catenulispora sp. MAP5-51]|uniref:serine hydrolase domain-containing protein n=1 Tax=Catenulispora sp. MAP5-51 TaxID=3156298 RepID=UPI0035167A28